MTRKRPVEDFDHHAPDFAADPWSVYERLRRQCPVLRSDAHGGYWVVSRYRDVTTVARDDASFRSGEGVTIPKSKGWYIPIDIDPPEFFSYRKLLQPLFSREAVAKLEPGIRAVATELIDDVIESGRCDIHDALCKPLPARVTFQMLGLPPDTWRDFVDPLEGTVPAGEDPEQQSMSRFARFFDVITRTKAMRRQEPKDDIVSFLVGARIDDRPLTEEEIDAVINLILGGGLLTTADAIGNALVYLERDRAARRRLIEEPGLMPLAVEEFLRYEAPVTGLARTVAKDCELHGQQLRKGEKVLMLWASANRDEAEFSNPDQVVLDRLPNHHVAFGAGIHHCLGAQLGRAEFRIALEEVLQRMPDYSIQLDKIRPSTDVGTTYGRLAIPMTFPPTARSDTPAQV